MEDYSESNKTIRFTLSYLLNKHLIKLRTFFGLLYALTVGFLFSKKSEYVHLFFAPIVVYILMLLCYIIHEILRLKKVLSDKLEFREDTGIEKTKAKLTSMLLPALLDVIYIIFYSIETSMFSSLSLGISRSFRLVFIFLLIKVINSKITIKQNDLTRNQYIGLILTLIAQILIGVVNYIQTGSIKSIIAGIILSVIVCSCISLKYIYEQRVFFEYSLNHLKAIGYQGFWGIIFMYIANLGNFVNCENNFLSVICFENNNGYLENLATAIEDLKITINLLLFFGFILFAFIYILLDVMSAKETTPYMRNISDSLFFVPVSIVMTFTSSKQNVMKITSVIIGSIIIAVGAFIFFKEEKTVNEDNESEVHLDENIRDSISHNSN